jgi:hypothetical protein
MKYIGKSVKPEHRNYLGSGRYLKRAIAKYGKEHFERDIIERCNDRDHLNEREEYWIKFYNANHSEEFYNISARAQGGHHGRDHNGKNNPMFGKKHPNHVPHFGEDNGMYGSHRALSENPNAKPIIVEDDCGNTYRRNSIKELCVELFGDESNYAKMLHMIRRCGKGLSPGKNSMFYGWTGKYIEPITGESK